MPFSPQPPYHAEEAKKMAIRSLWLAFLIGWASFAPVIIATMWHLSHIPNQECGRIIGFPEAQDQQCSMVIGLSGLLTFLLMSAIQWNFIRGIKRNKKHSILKLALFIILFMILSSGSGSSENFSPFMGKAHWLIYISAFGLFFTSLWQLYTLWILRKKLAYGLKNEKMQTNL